MTAAAPLLEVEDLHVTYRTTRGLVHAVRGVSFTLGREKLGIVGESGSGKSQTGRAILGLTTSAAEVRAKTLRFSGIDLRQANKRTWRSVRGSGMSMIMQDPKYSLNPVMTVGQQLVEAARLKKGLGRAEARAAALAMLEAVRIDDPERVLAAYPHELSGGMGQRAMIAMMLIPDPDVLIADEPTSALDVTIQLQVLAIMDRLVEARGMGLILISHDLELVATFCDRVLVMYGGRVVEELDAARLGEARHPYTKGLLGCLPRPEKRGSPLPVMVRDPAWLSAP
jgi:peptide/nickel transport system ATP-binding protein